jgi:hypothetical protein
MPTISESVLRGIDAALQGHAPDLRPHLHTLVETGRITGRGTLPGDSIYGKLTGVIPWEQGEPILHALETIERTHGAERKFGAHQINFLVSAWRRFATPPRLQSPPSA